MFLHLSARHSVYGGCLAPPGRHPPTATAADDTHPTGMLSCLYYVFGVNILQEVMALHTIKV